MRRARCAASLVVAFALAYGGVAGADPTSGGGTLPPWAYTFPHLELEFPRLMPLRFDFSAVSTPGYEMLRLPTFEATATPWSSERLSLTLFSRVTPALELDCTVTCQPELEQAIGGSARYALGAVAPAVPATWLFLDGARVQSVSSVRGTSMPPRAGSRVLGGIAGLLDF